MTDAAPATGSTFVATENVTAINYEVGLKGELFDNLQLSIALFNTEYSDLATR